jgi:hypothetical protein
MLKLDEISKQFGPCLQRGLDDDWDKDTLHVMISNNQVSQPCNLKISRKLRLYYNIFPRFENFM